MVFFHHKNGNNVQLNQHTTNLNKLCGSRLNMPPPLSSLCWCRSASRRRADRAWPQRSSRC